MIECCQCHQFYHIECLSQSFKVISPVRCPTCRLNWNGQGSLKDSKTTKDYRAYNVQ